MNKRKPLMLIIAIIVSFKLIGCNAELKQSNENKHKDTDIKVVLKNSSGSEDNQIIKNDRKGKRNIDDQIQLEKDKVLVNKEDTTSNIKENLECKEIGNSIVIHNNDKSVGNLKPNTKQSNKKVIPKKQLIKDKPVTTENKNTVAQKPIEETANPEETIKPEAVEDKTEVENKEPEKIADNVLCENAWFDETKPCNYIPDNLKPIDELGRSVPHFLTSQEAWNWGEKQIEDEISEFGCRGFTRMDGYQNDGSQFYFAYLKVCDTN